MAKEFFFNLLLVFLAVFISVSNSVHLQPSQAKALLKIQSLLYNPSILKTWKNGIDFCSTQPTAILTVVCYGHNITQLHIIGEKDTPLPANFSTSIFFVTLSKLPNLKVLKLVSLGLSGPLPGEISLLLSLEILDLSSNFFHGILPQEILSLSHLQSLILDGNNFTGSLPDRLDAFSALAVLSFKNNSLQGNLPDSLSSLGNLRILDLSNNNFSGEVPDLSNIWNLQVLDLQNNSLGLRFPLVTSKVVTIILSKNKFSSGIPEQVQSYHQLEHLDISENRFVGPFPPFLLSLPSIKFLNVSSNKLTGMLSDNLACSDRLENVDLSVNLLTGKLPDCLVLNPGNMVAQYDGNCFANGDEDQHKISFCQNEALAVGIMPHHSNKHDRHAALVLALSISFGIIGGILVVGITIFIIRKFRPTKVVKVPSPKKVTEKASTSYSSKLKSDAGYITQAMKLGAVSVPAYKVFSLEELEEATNNFASSSFVGEGSSGQVYRGELNNGVFVAIRCLKLKRSQSTQNFMQYIELVSKLRHQHLASALGHCFECYLDDASVSRIFLVFEHVPNGTLRSWISGKRRRQRLSWTQRIATATGVAKGIQFLQTGIVPGVFSNNLKITDISLDHNFVAKINTYNLPLLAEYSGKGTDHISSSRQRELRNTSIIYQDKTDIYDFGVILLEIITGRPIYSSREVEVLKDQIQVILTADDASRKIIVEQAIKSQCSNESLKTMIEICWRCLMNDPSERPPIEDILWNLQFAAQVQDGWKGDYSQSSETSPVSNFQNSRLKLTIYQE
ncbi:transmembrane signal receptor [Lithospermum erythrorhizon]|uniref:Transmembrane signal receptor n=1 Tax=Lithospermum erythrorhizon TaxID=34254 RepID=A0AAV3NJ78_LITER